MMRKLEQCVFKMIKILKIAALIALASTMWITCYGWLDHESISAWSVPVVFSILILAAIVNVFDDGAHDAPLEQRHDGS